MSAWDGLNRRKFPRVNYPCMVTICTDHGKKDALLTHTENVGIGGVCLTMKNGLKMFSPVELELDLMDMEEHIKCNGKIVWSVRRSSEEKVKPLFYDLGVEFVGIDEKSVQRIFAIVQKMPK